MGELGAMVPAAGQHRGRWRAVGLAILMAATSVVLATGTAQPAGADLSEATALCVESVGAVNRVQDTVFGPDGNLWWVEASPPAVGRLNVATGRISRFSSGLLFDRDLLKSITVGPDGNLWITSTQFNRVGRVTTA